MHLHVKKKRKKSGEKLNGSWQLIGESTNSWILDMNEKNVYPVEARQLLLMPSYQAWQTRQTNSSTRPPNVNLFTC